MLVITIEVDAPMDMAQAIKEYLAMLTEEASRRAVRVVSVKEKGR